MTYILHGFEPFERDPSKADAPAFPTCLTPNCAEVTRVISATSAKSLIRTMGLDVAGEKKMDPLPDHSVDGISRFNLLAEMPWSF